MNMKSSGRVRDQLLMVSTVFLKTWCSDYPQPNLKHL